LPLPAGWTAGNVSAGTRHHGGGAVTDQQLDLQNYVVEHHSAHSPQGRGGVIYLWRPGKDRHAGHSATILIGDQDEAVLTVFSSNWAVIGPDNSEPSWSWVLRNERLIRAHLADREELDALLEAGDALNRIPPPAVRPLIGADQPEADDDDELQVADWTTLHRDEGEDVVPGLLLPGRWTQFVGAAKSGKSTLLVWTTLRVADGLHPYDASPQDPHRILWMDGEMGLADLADIVDGCGYEAEKLDGWWANTDQPRLDTPAGAERLLKLVDRLKAEVVALDGLNSFLSPGFAEKDDQGWRSLFRLTISPLKRRGIAVVSSDNLGKDTTRGSRGSSVKTDKADAVYAVVPLAGGARLRASHRRTVGFSAEFVMNVEGVESGDNRPIRYVRAGGSGWPVGTKECRAVIESLKLASDAGWVKVAVALKDAAARAVDPTPYQWRKTTVQAAIRWRKMDPIWVDQDVPS
jgi:hypothetical protein